MDRLASVGARGGKGSRDHYSLSINSMNDPPRLNFFSCGKQLNRSLTIYQAIQCQAVADEDDDERYTRSDYALGDGRRIWDDVYTITYQRVNSQEDRYFVGVSGTSSLSKTSKNAMIGSSISETSWQ